MAPLSDRPTADVVLLIVAVLAAASVLLAGGGIFALALLRPDVDVSQALAAFGSTVSLLAGAVIGYLAGRGRGAGSTEAADR